MKRSLLDSLVCPFCRCALRLREEETKSDCVIGGALDCPRCGRTYPVEHGIPNMLDRSLPNMDRKRAEIHGWVDLSTKEQWYIPDETIDAALPYVVRDLGWSDPQWWATQESFDRLLRAVVKPGMRVLEVGAARCWGSRYFLERGCEYTACDMMADQNIGLGRGQFYIDRFGYFERVQADAESLPWADETFDLTYCVATLHHALDLGRMMGEFRRVTRRGGYVAALNEGARPFLASPNADIQLEERRHGINEHVHAPTTYLIEFWRHGLLVRDFGRAIGYEHLIGEDRKGQARRLLRLPLGQFWAGIAMLGFGGYDGVTLIAQRML